MIHAKTAFLYSRPQIMTLRGHTRILTALSYYSSLPTTSQLLPPILPTPAPADPNGSTSPSHKGFWSRMFERYSPTSQRDRIRIAELFYLAASRQASDP